MEVYRKGGVPNGPDVAHRNGQWQPPGTHKKETTVHQCTKRYTTRRQRSWSDPRTLLHTCSHIVDRSSPAALAPRASRSHPGNGRIPQSARQWDTPPPSSKPQPVEGSTSLLHHPTLPAIRAGHAPAARLLQARGPGAASAVHQARHEPWMRPVGHQGVQPPCPLQEKRGTGRKDRLSQRRLPPAAAICRHGPLNKANR